MDLDRKKFKKTHPFFFFLLFFISFWGFSGCDRYTQYNILRFLFDGVPHPDEPPKKDKTEPVKFAILEKIEDPQKKDPLSSSPRYRHPPVGERDDCSFCHGPVNRIVLPPVDICLKCHTEIKKRFSFIHPPAISDCMECHDPHDSQVKSLLKKTGNTLCFDCHDQKEIEEKEAHKEMKKEELICLSCHDPHGGTDRSLLK